MGYQRKPDGLSRDENGRIWDHQRYAKSIYWTGQMLSDLKRFYPTTLNAELAEILMVSQRTVVRKARELGLTKDQEWLRGIWEEHRMFACAKSKQLGYPGAFAMNRKRRKRNDTTDTLSATDT